jgi:hypothetical protein
MNVRRIARIGGQALAIYDVGREIRRADAKGDKLRLFDAMVNVLAIATAIAIIVPGDPQPPWSGRRPGAGAVTSTAVALRSLRSRPRHRP